MLPKKFYFILTSRCEIYALKRQFFYKIFQQHNFLIFPFFKSIKTTFTLIAAKTKLVGMK